MLQDQIDGFHVTTVEKVQRLTINSMCRQRPSLQEYGEAQETLFLKKMQILNANCWIAIAARRPLQEIERPRSPKMDVE